MPFSSRICKINKFLTSNKLNKFELDFRAKSSIEYFSSRRDEGCYHGNDMELRGSPTGRWRDRKPRSPLKLCLR